jgi:uncharacterized damage-inducible protein DinB
MRIVEPVAQEFEREAPTTRRVLARVPVDRSDWQPHPKSMSLGRLSAWMAGAPEWLAGIVDADGFDADQWKPLPIAASAAELLQTFDRGVEAARAAMGRMDDASAMKPWSFRMGGKPAMTVPRVGLLRLFLLSDAIHHRGQMTVFLRLLDVPVPSIYGPSADEAPA